MKTDNLRFYCWVHGHLSSIQKGMQAQHCSVDLLVKYQDSNEENSHWPSAWAKDCKTTILLDGGNSLDLDIIEDVLCKAGVPFCNFHEDEGLGSIKTAVGCVLPRRIFDARAEFSISDYHSTRNVYTLLMPYELIDTKDPLYSLIELQQSSRLAV